MSLSWTAEAVVIGRGVNGTSIAFHPTGTGAGDLVLLER